MSSLLPTGPVLPHAAAARVRTLPGGAVCVADAGGGSLVHVGPSGAHRSTPNRTGERLVDFLGLEDGSWVLLAQRPSGQVRARRIADDGAELWSSDGGLESVLCDAEGALFAVTEGPPRRLVSLDPETGATADVQTLDGARGACFMNGAARVGYRAEDSWITVDARSGERSEVRLEAGSGMDYPIGLDDDGRSYWNRFATLRRLAPDGRSDWELEAGQAIVDGERVWIQQRPPGAGELIALPLEADARSIALPTPSGESRTWTLVGRAPGGGFLLYGGGEGDAGVVARIGPGGDVADVHPAGESIWLESFELQRPNGPAVTGAGDLDIATRGPAGLHVIRITPG